jgi:hypothetical protein
MVVRRALHGIDLSKHRSKNISVLCLKPSPLAPLPMGEGITDLSLCHYSEPIKYS